MEQESVESQAVSELNRPTTSKPENLQRKATDTKSLDKEVKDEPEDVACSWHSRCQPRCCQCFARPSCLLLWLCFCSFIQGMVVSGFVKSAITTLELRYDLTSSESGFISSMYDVGCLVCVVPVSYFGHRYRRSRLISVGLVIMGVGSIVFFIPHLITEKYIYQSPEFPLCYQTGKVYKKFCANQSLNKYKFVFLLGQFLHGVGASPLYTLGIAYLDDNLTIEDSGIFLGSFYAMSIIGPAIGFLLNARFLSIYVEPGAPPNDIGPNNASHWVGAWWIGFLVSGLASFSVAVPMFGFPKSFVGSASVRLKRRLVCEVHKRGELDESGAGSGGDATFGKSMMVLLKNPTMLFLSFACAVQLLIVASLSTFGPKILQTLFEFSTSKATILMGLVSVFAGVIGMMAGGLIIRFYNLPLGRLLWFCVASAAISSLFALGLLLKCKGQKFAGINHNYPLTPNQPDELTAPCNMNCSCQKNKFMYNPVCGADSIVYYSPCYAGCKDNGTMVNGVKYFANCSCISGRISTKNSVVGLYSAAQDLTERCLEGNCGKTSVIVTMLFLLTTCLFSLSVPTLQCTMRVIPPELKDLGLGLQWVIVRLFGSIPGPPLVGLLIDYTCSLWASGCDLKGSCSFYNSERFWLTLLIFTVALKLVEILFLALAAASYVPPNKSVQK